MKKTAALISALLALSCALCACTKLPSEPATTKTTNYSVRYNSGEAVTDPAPVNEGETVKEFETVTEKNTTAVSASEKKGLSDAYDFVLADYYVYGKSYGKIANVELNNFGLNAVEGYAKVELTDLSAGQDQFRIGCIMYDEDGKLVKTTFLLADIKSCNYKEGDIVDCRFDIPAGYNVTKVEFTDYAKVADRIKV